MVLQGPHNQLEFGLFIITNCVRRASRTDKAGSQHAEIDFQRYIKQTASKSKRVD